MEDYSADRKSPKELRHNSIDFTEHTFPSEKVFKGPYEIHSHSVRRSPHAKNNSLVLRGFIFGFFVCGISWPLVGFGYQLGILFVLPLVVLSVWHCAPSLFVDLIIAATCARINSQKPNRIVIVRHAESQGNLDSSVYCRVPDNRVELTPKGKLEAEEAGRKLGLVIGTETVRFFVSPYRRSQQTFEYILKGAHIQEGKYTVREDPRLREQDWGNLQNAEEVKKQMKERKEFGAFYYRFPNGESGADVYDRVTEFWNTLNREWNYAHCLENFVIVSHGITCRLLLMRYFKWTVEEFHQLANFENCEMAILELQQTGRYALVTPIRRN